MPLAGGLADPNPVAAIANHNGISNALISGTTTSSSYSDLPDAPSSFTFVKLSAETALVVNGTLVLFSTGGTGEVRFGVNVNSTDYDLLNLTLSTADVWFPVPGSTRITGLAAGTYTVQARWRRVAGAGTLTTNSNGWISLQAMEVQ